MSLAVLRSRALAGMEALPVSVEVHLANGLPSFTIVGLPDAEVREAKDRVRAALQNVGFEIPARRITINLAPADLPKESGRFDLYGEFLPHFVTLFSFPFGQLKSWRKTSGQVVFFLISDRMLCKKLHFVII